MNEMASAPALHMLWHALYFAMPWLAIASTRAKTQNSQFLHFFAAECTQIRNGASSCRPSM